MPMRIILRARFETSLRNVGAHIVQARDMSVASHFAQNATIGFAQFIKLSVIFICIRAIDALAAAA